MELRCVQTSPLSGVPRNALSGIPYSCCRTIVSCPLDKTICSGATRFIYSYSRVPFKGTALAKSKANYIVSSSDVGQKDDNLVFVAGATGKVGSRTVRELLKLGFKVRAGVRSVQRATALVESVKNLKVENGETQYVDMLELVECDLERADQISTALGNSSTVLCCIGASEKEILDTSGPYRIDYKATENLIVAATSAKVSHFILVTSLGTNKVGFPAAILNLFWGVLFWKRKAEEALLASGLPYTIVRPGGMERPTDSFKETHNITLCTEDTLFGGLVSNLQVAELLAFMAKNRNLSYCKVVEVVAQTTAPLLPFEDLLNKIPSKRELATPKESSEKIAAISESTPEVATASSAGTPLSPYVCYEDLKPPTSPTPTKSSKSSNVTNNIVPAATPTEVDSSEKPEILRDAAIAPKEPKSSPYIRYHDLKPPSSPSPSAPI